MAGSRDFKVKNGLIVGDSATIKGPLVVEGGLTLSAGTSITGIYAGFDSDFNAKSTTDLSEGSNLYYTTVRADSDFDTRLVTKSTTDLSEGNNLYYTTARADSDAKAALLGGLGITYDSASGVISIPQEITTTSNVTFAKITGDSASLDGIIFRQQPSELTSTVGSLYFDSDEMDGLVFKPRTREGATDNRVRLGMQNVFYVHNMTGAVVNRGDVVYISGTAHGLHPQISLAQADTSTIGTVALANTDIADGAHGYVTRFGLVDGLDTSAEVEGADVYLSVDSAGKWTTTEVSIDDGYPLHIGKVIRTDATSGTILVDPFAEHMEYLRIEDRLKVTGKIEGDSASISQIDFNTLYAEHINYKEGAVWYDNIHHTLNFWGDDSNVVHEIGIEEHQRVYNNTGSPIPKGSPLYFSGNYNPGGELAVPTVDLADATDVNAYNAQGLAASEIPNNSYGYCIVSGQIDEVNTSALNAGDNFFVGLTPGAVQNASPTYPNYPMCLGWVVKSDSAEGILLVNQQNHSVNTFRVKGDTHIGADLRVDGNLLVVGSQTVASTANVSIGGNIQYLNAGDTIGAANTNFVGSGLNDAEYKGHYSGDSDTKSFFVKIDSAGATDTFEWGFDSAVGTEATGILITGNDQLLDSNYGISINFGATTGHTLGDKWTGAAAATDIDTGFFTNRNEGEAGDGYTHVGFFFDVSDDKWRLVSKYDSEPEAPININSPTYQTGTLVANIEGSVTGGITGNAGTATALQTSRNFSLTGDVTAVAQGFDGTGNVILTTVYNPGSIVNADINASAGIVDTKLATISTAGKVQNSATTATDANTGSTIVARDVSGNFSAGTITATFSGNLTGNVTGQVSDISNLSTDSLGEGSTNLYFTNARVDTVLDNTSTDSIGEGSTNLYFTNARVDTVLDATTTDSIGEGVTNLYYTTARSDSDFDVRLATKSTTNLTEGTNQYFTNTRARSAISVTDNGGDGSLGYNSGTGVITYTGPSATEVRAHFSAGTNIGISSGEISTSATPSFTSLTLSVADGTTPMTVTSTTLVSNLNADLLDGQEGSHYRIDVYDASGTLLN